MNALGWIGTAMALLVFVFCVRLVIVSIWDNRKYRLQISRIEANPIRDMYIWKRQRRTEAADNWQAEYNRLAGIRVPAPVGMITAQEASAALTAMFNAPTKGEYILRAKDYTDALRKHGLS